MRKFTCVIQILSFMVGLLACAHVSAAAQANRKMLGAETARKAARQDKQSLLSSLRSSTVKPTPAQQKLSTDLLQLVDRRFLPKTTKPEQLLETMRSSKRFTSNAPSGQVDQEINQGRVYVYIYFKTEGNLSALDGFEANVTDSDMENHYVAAWVNVSELEAMAALDDVRAIRPVLPPITQAGSVLTEGDAIHGSGQVRCTYSQRGAGMKVGVISDGVQNRAEAQATGDLPQDGEGLTVLADNYGGDEGTAMLEIVHDMAPEAELYFHHAGINSIAFNSAITSLANAGCHIICDDIIWTTEPFFEDGRIATHAGSIVQDKDIVYVSCAGNTGMSHYQGTFHSLSSNPMFHDFSHGKSSYTDLYLNISAGSTVFIVLQWDDSFGSAQNDYDLYLISYSTMDIVQSSETFQFISGDPIEIIQYTANAFTAGDFAIWVTQPDGSAETLEMFIYTNGQAYNYINNISTEDSIFGHQAMPEVLAVGAIAADDEDNDDIERYSSQGPATISHPIAETRDKPDICASDGVSVTGAGDFPSTFWGTSAAVPHVAGAAAQLWGAMPECSADVIRDMLLADTVDLGETGFDYIFGYGRLDILNAFYSNFNSRQFPYIEGFEDGLGDWINVTDSDTHDWARSSGTGVIMSTGPETGANGSQWYMTFETSAGQGTTAGDTAILESPEIDGANRRLTFRYHMFGASIGSLHVDLLHDGFHIQDLWSLSGQQQNSGFVEYDQATVDLTDYSGPIRIRFRAVAAGGNRGDIAIDDIQISGDDGNDQNPPAAPTELSAVTSEGKVSLDWADNCELDLAGYTVYRSTTSGSDYTPIADNLTDSEYIDDDIVDDMTYYYVVTAVDLAGNESAPSMEASTSNTGSAPAIGDDFESGDFSMLDWTFPGSAMWTVTTQTSHSGLYSAQAGTINDNQSSGLSVTLECPNGTIEFYCKVSSEMSFDLLEFYIDGRKKGQWSGEQDWTQVSFPVTEGNRRFNWVYSKDGSFSGGQDTAWIDDISIQ